ncbi:MAG TPA: hypothetical protein VFG66_10800 [Gemmatimonadales bacterium]|nr:hypothetical protein [Gemmatimonadales bacterium]
MRASGRENLRHLLDYPPFQLDDLVEGLVRLMDADALHDPVNLGNPDEFSIRQLAEEIAACCGREPEIPCRAGNWTDHQGF